VEFVDLQTGVIRLSDRIEHGQGENPPITLGVEKSTPEPDEKHVPLLTVLYGPDSAHFRIAAMVLEPSSGLQSLTVRWWALGVA
jgi:hypothetical protein